MKIKFVFLNLIIFLMLQGSIFANEVHDYVTAPEGFKAVLLYYDRISGNEVYNDGDLATSDATFEGNVALFRAVYYGRSYGYLWNLNAIIPFGQLNLDTTNVGGNETSTSQIGDLTLVLGCHVIENHQTRTYVGVSGYLTAPTGEYESDKPDCLQLAHNRWGYKPEIYITQGFGSTPFSIEGGGYVEFYTDNDRYTDAHFTLKKEPVYEGEFHLVWDVNKSYFVSTDYFYQKGGETSTNGIDNGDELDDHKAGFTFGVMISPKMQLLIKAQKLFKTENCIKTNDLGFRLAYYL